MVTRGFPEWGHLPLYATSADAAEAIGGRLGEFVGAGFTRIHILWDTKCQKREKDDETGDRDGHIGDALVWREGADLTRRQ